MRAELNFLSSPTIASHEGVSDGLHLEEIILIHQVIQPERHGCELWHPSVTRLLFESMPYFKLYFRLDLLGVESIQQIHDLFRRQGGGNIRKP